jgi:high affinity Mn2+ porin
MQTFSNSGIHKSAAFLLLSLFGLSFLSPVACAQVSFEENDSKNWSTHFQATTVTQVPTAFHSPYAGPNSLQTGFQIPSSLTSTLFIGHKLWQNGYIFVNPEESAGSGLSYTHGIAAFPNGEIYRVDDPKPVLNLSRFFVQQDFGFGGGKEKIDDDLNQFEAEKDIRRLTLVAGKFSLNDYLDNNAYAHDPRTQFLNWALMDNGAWDYAADVRGYTWGLFTEIHLENWSYRFALVQVPMVANGADLDGNLTQAHGENLEAEYRYQFSSHPGKVRVLGFANQAKMGSYAESLALAKSTSTTPDITATRRYRTKYGFGLNVEQELTKDLGLFARIGWNDGSTESFVFTEIDRSFSVGASLKGTSWHRSDDLFGLALIAGGMGFLLGDGNLNYAPEEVVELFYSYQLFKSLALSLDLQGINHPGYNSDRGPLAVYGFRVHYEI